LLRAKHSKGAGEEPMMHSQRGRIRSAIISSLLLAGLLWPVFPATTAQLEESPAEQLVACQGALVLIAGRSFFPDSRPHPVKLLPTNPLPFALPERIPVTIGNAGRGLTIFHFVTPSGLRVDCEYRGATSNAGSRARIGIGRPYEFARCHG